MGLLTRSSKEVAPVLGYLTGLEEHYEVQKEIGKGGNGVVRLAVHKKTGREVAVKSIPKVLRDPAASERKRASQIPYLKREVEVLLALRGTLNVANLEEVYEDSSHVHLVMELCKGGELVGRAKGQHYSERTVASFIRAVLRTVIQCHAKHIIHRDIKAENFLLHTEDLHSPVKAIDFGLAIFYDPDKLPVSGLNVEGTPWYLAPEVCRGKWYPASDVWAVGVMAAYLLTGHYPYVDKVCPDMPDLARTLRHICYDPLDLSGKEWVPLSEEARAFITALLVKDPLQRPSAEEALKHPWLRGDGPKERSKGAPLDRSVVQRLQRFAQSGLFKRSVLQHIAQDLVSMHFTPDPTAHGGAVFRDRSVRGGAAHRERSFRGGSAFSPFALSSDRSVHGGSVHGGLKGLPPGLPASPFAQQQYQTDRSVRGGTTLRGGTAWLERSVRAGSEFFERSVKSGTAFLERTRSGSSGGGAGPLERTRSGGGAGAMERSRSGGAGTLDKMRGFGSAVLERSRSGKGGSDKSTRGGSAFQRVQSFQRADSSVFLPVATPYSRRLAELLDKLGLDSGDKRIDQAQLTQALKDIGYKITDEEGEELFTVIDTERSGKLGKTELSAGLMDWKAFQDTYKDRWLESVRRVFQEMDGDGSGTLDADEIAHALGAHLSPYEVDAAVHEALLSAAADGGADGKAKPGIDFEHFLQLLRDGHPALDTFEDRLSNHTSRRNSGQLQEVSGRGLGGKSRSQQRAKSDTSSKGSEGGCCACSIQ